MVSPLNVPLIVGLVIALLGTAVAVLGGNPVTRRVLEIATHGRVRDGANGGIMLERRRPGVARRRAGDRRRAKCSAAARPSATSSGSPS